MPIFSSNFSFDNVTIIVQYEEDRMSVQTFREYGLAFVSTDFY